MKAVEEMAVKNLVQRARGATTRTSEAGQKSKEADRKETRLARLKHKQVNSSGQLTTTKLR